MYVMHGILAPYSVFFMIIIIPRPCQHNFKHNRLSILVRIMTAHFHTRMLYLTPASGRASYQGYPILQNSNPSGSFIETEQSGLISMMKVPVFIPAAVQLLSRQRKKNASFSTCTWCTVYSIVVNSTGGYKPGNTLVAIIIWACDSISPVECKNWNTGIIGNLKRIIGSFLGN